METLGEALPKEMARVREMIPIYSEIGPSGAPALFMMQVSLSAAEKAMIEQDVVAMIAAYQDLKDYSS